jgi:hypothetical protein
MRCNADNANVAIDNALLPHPMLSEGIIVDEGIYPAASCLYDEMAPNHVLHRKREERQSITLRSQP